jgi:hypothetical protein
MAELCSKGGGKIYVTRLGLPNMIQSSQIKVSTVHHSPTRTTNLQSFMPPFSYTSCPLSCKVDLREYYDVYIIYTKMLYV